MCPSCDKRSAMAIVGRIEGGQPHGLIGELGCECCGAAIGRQFRSRVEHDGHSAVGRILR
jgi:hypothetical protein